MARKYVNPAGPVPLAAGLALAEARARAEQAAARLRAAEGANPMQPGWDGEYAAALAAGQAADRRLAALESLRARQVERGGKRAAAVTASAGDLKSMAAALAASRDKVAAAARAHLAGLAALALAEHEHNELLAEGRARLASAGLRVHDDLLDEGQEHNEGALDGPGLRAEGIDWTPMPVGGVAAHACRLVYAGRGPLHPLSTIGKYAWRPFEVEARADGLRVPSLKDAGAALPPEPARPAIARAAVAERPPGPLLPDRNGYIPSERQLARQRRERAVGA